MTDLAHHLPALTGADGAIRRNALLLSQSLPAFIGRSARWNQWLRLSDLATTRFGKIH